MIAGRRRRAGRRPADGRDGGVRRDLRGRPTPTTSTRRSPRCARATPTSRSSSRATPLVAHYTQTDQVKAAITQGALRRVRRRRQRRARPGSRRRTPRGRAGRGRLAQHDPVLTPGLLGWAVAMSAGVRRRGHPAGLAAEQAAAAAAARAGLDPHRRRAPGSRSRSRSRWSRWPSSSALGAAAFGLTLTGPGGCRSRCWSSAPCASCRSACSPARSPRPRRARSTPPTSWCCRWPSSAARSSRSTGAPQLAAGVLAACCRSSTSTTGMLDVMVRGRALDRGAGADGYPRGFALVVTLVAARLFRWETD